MNEMFLSVGGGGDAVQPIFAEYLPVKEVPDLLIPYFVIIVLEVGNGVGKRRICCTAVQYLTPAQSRAVLKQA
jgi:hypothetical protein